MDNLIMDTIGAWFVNLLSTNPVFASILAFLGMARLCIKPAMTLLQVYVKWTPYDQDDKWLESVEQSKGYKLVLYLLDWLLSVKMPGKK